MPASRKRQTRAKRYAAKPFSPSGNPPSASTIIYSDHNSASPSPVRYAVLNREAFCTSVKTPSSISEDSNTRRRRTQTRTHHHQLDRETTYALRVAFVPACLARPPHLHTEAQTNRRCSSSFAVAWMYTSCRTGARPAAREEPVRQCADQPP